MFFVVPALFGALSTVASIAIVAADGAKTAMVAGTAVGTAVALSRVADSRKAKERSDHETLRQALAEAYAQGRADGQRVVAEEFRNMAFSEGCHDAMQDKSLGDGSKGLCI